MLLILDWPFWHNSPVDDYCQKSRHVDCPTWGPFLGHIFGKWRKEPLVLPLAPEIDCVHCFWKAWERKEQFRKQRGLERRSKMLHNREGHLWETVHTTWWLSKSFLPHRGGLSPTSLIPFVRILWQSEKKEKWCFFIRQKLLGDATLNIEIGNFAEPIGINEPFSHF